MRIRTIRTPRATQRARVASLPFFPIALFALLTMLAPSAGALGPGDPAPGFTLPDAYGTEYALEALRGKVVLLAFVGYG